MAGPALTLEEYRSLVAHLPRPTSEQMECFAQHVADDHSWYKHLPLLPPGRPFVFYLDPYAGVKLKRMPDGSIRVVDCEDGTAYYRDRFGHLVYYRVAGSAMYFSDRDGGLLFPADTACAVFDPQHERLRPLPAEVSEAGTAFVSGLVHPRGGWYGYWRSLVPPEDEIGPSGEWPLDWKLPEWPEESGGPEVLRRILDRCRLLVNDRSLADKLTPTKMEIEEEKYDLLEAQDEKALSEYVPRSPDPRYEEDPEVAELCDETSSDFPFCKLVQPERRRQLNGMIKAMERAVELTLGTVSGRA